MDVSEMLTRPEMVVDPVTSPDDYRGDTIADPVGNAIRQKNAEHNQYPPFVLKQFETSNVNIFGKPFPNNGEALRPNASYLDALYEVADENMTDASVSRVVDLALDKRGELIDKIIESVEWMLCDESGLSKEFRWNNIVAPSGNEAYKYHARRAITKYTYQSSVLSLQNAPDGVLPQWLSNQEDKMLQAGLEAGFYHVLAMRLRELNENKPFELSPAALVYQIKLQTQGTADYYSKPRDNKVETESLDTLKSQAIEMMNLC